MKRESFQLVPEVHAAGDPSNQGIRVPFVRPALPPADRLQPAFEDILKSGRLT